MTAPTLTLETTPDAAVMGVIYQGLTDYNLKQSGERPEYVVITARDPAQAVVGGLFGATYLGWLSVQVVWLEEAWRGRGLGRRIMEMAEAEALRRGCPRVFLETLQFQAPDFYRKLGYEIFSTLPDFPPGGARYAMVKQLAPGAGPA